MTSYDDIFMGLPLHNLFLVEVVTLVKTLFLFMLGRRISDTKGLVSPCIAVVSAFFARLSLLDGAGEFKV